MCTLEMCREIFGIFYFLFIHKISSILRYSFLKKIIRKWNHVMHNHTSFTFIYKGVFFLIISRFGIMKNIAYFMRGWRELSVEKSCLTSMGAYILTRRVHTKSDMVALIENISTYKVRKETDIRECLEACGPDILEKAIAKQ